MHIFQEDISKSSTLPHLEPNRAKTRRWALYLRGGSVYDRPYLFLKAFASKGRDINLIVQRYEVEKVCLPGW